MPKRHHESGELWFERRPESPYLQLCWYDPAKRKTRRVSTGCVDRAGAEEFRARFVLKDQAAEPAAHQDRPAEPKAHYQIADVVDAYYEQHAKNQAQAGQVSAAADHFRAFFEDKPISALSGEEGSKLLQKYVDVRAAAGRVAGTIRRELGTLRSAMNALGRAYPELRIPTILDLPVPEGRPYWLTQEEFDRLVAACDWEHTQIYCWLGVSTGGRSGALFDLTWEQVDFAAGVIHLNTEHRTQTSKKRPTVRMGSQLVELLKGLRQRNPKAMYVLEIAGKGIDSIKRSFRAAVTKAGLDPAKITPNTLRHTCASWMVQAGIPLIDVAAFLGHSDCRMVEKHYGHLLPDYQQRAVAAIGTKLDGVTKTLAPQMHPKTKKGSAAQAAEPLSYLVEPRRIELLTSTMPL